MSVPNRSFLFRHRLISFFRDLDIKGIRRLSVILPKVLLPAPEKVGKHVLKTIHGVDLLIDPSVDEGVELSLFQTGTYERGTIQLLHDFLQPGDTFLDVGANIGLMSSIASKIVGTSGLVYAVEANPKTLDILSHNLTLNNCDNTQILPIAVSNQKGEAILYENWSVNRGGSSLLSQGDQEGIKVPMERLDDLFSEDTPLKLVKMDVEGVEPSVLEGGLNWFRKQQPVFIIEVSTEREFEAGATAKDVLKMLETIGKFTIYKQKSSKERRGKLIEITSEDQLPKHDNIICIPLKRLS
ncbi:MAG: FkbM family methyltransferase [Fluviicola sp.]|nr:FkbM family methyltransferase [Fluviicola sp.]